MYDTTRCECQRITFGSQVYFHLGSTTVHSLASWPTGFRSVLLTSCLEVGVLELQGFTTTAGLVFFFLTFFKLELLCMSRVC